MASEEVGAAAAVASTAASAGSSVGGTCWAGGSCTGSARYGCSPVYICLKQQQQQQQQRYDAGTCMAACTACILQAAGMVQRIVRCACAGI